MAVYCSDVHMHTYKADQTDDGFPHPSVCLTLHFWVRQEKLRLYLYFYANMVRHFLSAHQNLGLIPQTPKINPSFHKRTAIG